MYCPNCGMEYTEKASRCSDCGVELVSALPDDAGSAEQDAAEAELVELASFATAPEADMVQEILQKNDIRSVLRGDTDPIGATSGAAPATLLVERRDEPRARELYDAFFGEAASGEAPGEEETSPEQS